MHGQIRDEFDEIITPWPTGFVFDKNTSQADMELLNKLCHEKDIAVFGITSNIYEEFDEYDSKYLYRKLSQKNVWSLAKHMNGSQSFEKILTKYIENKM